MNSTPSVVDAAIRGIQEKKGKKIEVVNLQKVNTSVTNCLVICQGSNPSQVTALSNEVWDQVHKLTGEKPLSIDGIRNSEWVAMDYGDVVVHIFLPQQREYYDLEHLWADAEIKEIADLD
ncbi:MAG: ribosome silencing factor [Bacteroidaceae bacterium]|jgi:ribosome-associated protein